MEEIKGIITKIKFDVSKSKNIYAKIWINEADINIENDGIMVLDGLHLLFSKVVGMKITLLKDNKGWYKPLVSQGFNDFYNGDTQQAILYRNAFTNFKKSLLDIKFGESIEIADIELPSIISGYLKDELFIKDCIIKGLENNSSDYAKKIISEMGLKKTSQTMNVDDIINGMASRFIRNSIPNHRIIYSEVE